MKADKHGWMPIESAPKDGTVVDLWVRTIGAGKRITECKFDCGSWEQRGYGIDPTTITHFRPIPKPPESEE